MKKRSKRVIPVLSLLLAMLMLIPAFAAPASAASNTDEFVQLVNAERAKHDLPALKTTNSGLNTAAKTRAAESAVKFDIINHKRPDGAIWHTVLKENGVTHYSTAGETLAAGYATPAEAFAAWMNSSKDSANILHKDFTHMGVGIYEGKFQLNGEDQDGFIVAVEFIAESKNRHIDTYGNFAAFFVNLFVSFVNAWNNGILWIKETIGCA